MQSCGQRVREEVYIRVPRVIVNTEDEVFVAFMCRRSERSADIRVHQFVWCGCPFHHRAGELLPVLGLHARIALRILVGEAIN